MTRDSDFAERVHRLSAGMRQAAIARRFGVGSTTVRRVLAERKRAERKKGRGRSRKGVKEWLGDFRNE